MSFEPESPPQAIPAVLDWPDKPLSLSPQKILSSARYPASPISEKSDSVANIYNDRIFIIICATTTPEKIEKDNATARLLGLPMIFIGLREILEFHSPDEVLGDREAHAAIKMDEIKPQIRQLQQDDTPIRRVVEARNIFYHRQNVAFMVNDMSLGLPKLNWDGSKHRYAQFLSDDTIKKAEEVTERYKDIKEVFTGPSSEIGPALSGVGIPRFFEIARETGKDRPVHALDISSVHVRTLESAEYEAVWSKTAQCLNQIFTGTLPEHIEKQWLLDASSKHLCLPDHPNISQAEMYEEYMRDHSPQSQILKELYSHLLSLPYTPPKPEELAAHAAKMATRRKKPFKVRVLSGNIPKLPSMDVKKGATHNDPRITDRYLRSFDLSRNFSDCNAFILASPLKHKTEEKTKKTICSMAYIMWSADVAKQLEPQHTHTPFIVAEDASPNHISLAPLMEIHRQLSPGMSKDYNRVPAYEPNPEPYIDQKFALANGIEHQAFGSFDYIRRVENGAPVSIAAFNDSIDQLLRRLKQERPPYAGAPLTPPQERIWIKNKETGYRTDIFKLLHYTSAGSHNRLLCETNAFIGEDAALQGIGYVWGLMDREAGGEGYKAYAKNGGVWAEGYSTPTIITLESSGGKMVKCDYAELVDNIYIRQAKMAKAANMTTATPGGKGTFQEIMGTLKLFDDEPELTKDAILSLHNITLFDKPYFDPLIDLAFTQEEARKLRNERQTRDGKIRITLNNQHHHDLVAEQKSLLEEKHARKLAAEIERATRHVVIRGAGNSNIAPRRGLAASFSRVRP